MRRGDALGRPFTKAILHNDNFSIRKEGFLKDAHPLNYSVGFVIPSLNEEKNIGQVLIRLYKIGFTNILVIDGLSNDGTRKIATENGAKIVLQVGRGKGQAVRQVLSNDYLDTDALVLMDADGSISAEEIPRFIEELAKGTDIAK